MKDVSIRTQIKRLIRKSQIWTITFENQESKFFDILEESEGRFKFRKFDPTRTHEQRQGEKEQLISDLKISKIEDLEVDIEDEIMSFSFVYRSPGSDKVQKIIITEA